MRYNVPAMIQFAQLLAQEFGELWRDSWGIIEAYKIIPSGLLRRHDYKTMFGFHHPPHFENWQSLHHREKYE